MSKSDIKDRIAAQLEELYQAGFYAGYQAGMAARAANYHVPPPQPLPVAPQPPASSHQEPATRPPKWSEWVRIAHYSHGWSTGRKRTFHHQMRILASTHPDQVQMRQSPTAKSPSAREVRYTATGYKLIDAIRVAQIDAIRVAPQEVDTYRG